MDPFANNCAIVDIYINLDCRDPLDLSSAYTDEFTASMYKDNFMDFQYNSKCFNGSISKS